MKLIPLFPLEIVVYPGESLNLHIFEPRYQQLINECKEEKFDFGIPYYQKDQRLQFGCMVRLEQIAKIYPNGRMDIRSKGLAPIEVTRTVRTFRKKLYPGGYVKELIWDLDGDAVLYEEIAKQLLELYGFMKIKKTPIDFEKAFTTFDLGHKVGFSQDQEYQFLQIPGEKARQLFVLEHLELLIPKVKEMEEMRKKIQMNGHFKNVIPPNL